MSHKCRQTTGSVPTQWRIVGTQHTDGFSWLDRSTSSSAWRGQARSSCNPKFSWNPPPPHRISSPTPFVTRSTGRNCHCRVVRLWQAVCAAALARDVNRRSFCTNFWCQCFSLARRLAILLRVAGIFPCTVPGDSAFILIVLLAIPTVAKSRFERVSMPLRPATYLKVRRVFQTGGGHLVVMIYFV